MVGALFTAYMPRSMICPMLLSLVIDMDRFQIPERVGIEIARLGYVSCDKVCKYHECEQSTIMSMDAENAKAESYRAALSLWVDNNVYHNLRPLDDCGTFHIMGFISVSVFVSGR